VQVVGGLNVSAEFLDRHLANKRLEVYTYFANCLV